MSQKVYSVLFAICLAVVLYQSYMLSKLTAQVAAAAPATIQSVTPASAVAPTRGADLPEMVGGC